MEDEKKDWLINGVSGCPVQLSAKNLCLENAKSHKYLKVPKGSDDYPRKSFPYLAAFAETLQRILLQYLRQLTLNTANNCINIIDNHETQLGDVSVQGEKELKSGGLSETNSDILPYAMSEKKNDVQTYAQNTGNNRLYFNKERKAELYIEDACFPEKYTESLVPKMWKAALMRRALKLETYCDRLQPLMKGHFDTESIYFLLDSKVGDSKPWQGQEEKQVLEKMLCGKNLTEVLQLLKRKRVISSCEYDALMIYINEQQVPSANTRCEKEDTKGYPAGIPCFSITRYQELLQGRPDIALKINDGKTSSLRDFIFIDEIQDLLSVDSKHIHIFQNFKETLRRGDLKGTEDKEDLTSIVSKSKFDLLAMVLTVLAEQMEIWEAMQRMTPCMQEEASPPTASSASSSLSQSESLSSLEWEDSSNDTLRQLLDIAMGRQPLPPDGSALFIIPIIGEMTKSDERQEKGLSRSATSSLSSYEMKENNGTETSLPKKKDNKNQTFEKYINLVQFVKNQLAHKQFL